MSDRAYNELTGRWEDVPARIRYRDRYKTAEVEAFRVALGDFIRAGYRLCDAWDAGEFNADVVAPLPERIRPPLSLDEWLDELAAHYEKKLG